VARVTADGIIIFNAIVNTGPIMSFYKIISLTNFNAQFFIH